MNAIDVRPVIQSDIASLMGLDHAATTDYVWQLEIQRDPRGAQIATTFREVRLPRPVNLAYPNDPFSLADDWADNALMLAALSGDNPVGYLVVVEPRPAVAWITDVVVSPRLRRQGIASSMLLAAQKWAQERNTRRLFLEMQSKNHPAIRMAQKHGYEFCGYNDHYYSTQDIALFFTRAP